MKYASTRTPALPVTFRDAVFQGLAPDGGLFQPLEEPDLRQFFFNLERDTSFVEIAARMTAALFPEDFPEPKAHEIAEKAFGFSPVLTEIADGMQVLELFHGPSCAFKDFGASFLATVMESFLEGSDKRAVILTATSGDTGSAVAQAFHGKRNIDVVILYPSGRVSPLQEKQLTTVGGNVVALEVAGSFDDCQRMVKEAFADRELGRQVPLTSANSINIGRLIPQSFYFAYAFAQLRRTLSEEFIFCVPSGNYGNLTAGVLAWRWGLPVTGFIAAANRNSVVPEYLESGTFQPRPSVQTPSNAMDVGNPSNFERLCSIFQDDWSGMRSMIRGETVDDVETLETMKRYYEEHGVFLDPHTAVGVRAAERLYHRELDSVVDVVVLSTAHPAKFSEIVAQATGAEPELPEALARVIHRQKHSVPVGNTVEELKQFLTSRYST
ncbi:MAG TPA: threonine synthase [Spirochaetia bacterium]|nr:threonine synthase [Spirochaetia bacterium]